MVYYKPVKVMINAAGLVKVILNIVVWQHDFPDWIVINRGSLFTSKIWFLLYYFFSIKQRFFTTFYPQTNGQTKKQNSSIDAYLQVFINFNKITGPDSN